MIAFGASAQASEAAVNPASPARNIRRYPRAWPSRAQVTSTAYAGVYPETMSSSCPPLTCSPLLIDGHSVAVVGPVPRQASCVGPSRSAALRCLGLGLGEVQNAMKVQFHYALGW
jgi:hypothetical protein